MGDRRGVEAIGLGELAGRTGKIADLTRIDHRQGQMLGGKGAGDHGLVSPRRLERDQGRSQGAQTLDKTLKTFVVTRDDEGLPAWPDADVEPILRHIDSNEQFHFPSLHMRARDAAPATVRDLGIGGWGAMLRNGLFDPRSAKAPIRRRGANLSSAARPRGDTRSAEGASRRMLQSTPSAAAAPGPSFETRGFGLAPQIPWGWIAACALPE